MLNKKGILTLLGLLLVVIIVTILCYVILKVYVKRPPLEEESQGLSSPDINTSNYQSVLDSTKNKLQDINKRVKERESELEN